MIPKLNYEVYKVCVYKVGDLEAILNDIIYIPENVEKYRIPHEIASDVELRLRADMLTEEEQQQAKQEEKTAYNKGLADAWEAARKICRPVPSGGMTSNDLIKIFDIPYTNVIITKYTAAEAIAKIKAYEDKQQKIEQEIKVGDEVIDDDISKRGVVTNIELKESGNVYSVLWDDGRFCEYYEKEIRKIGRHFPQFKELLKAMKEK